MIRKRRRRRASSDGEGEGGSQRVQLACFWCRSKRVRCSGTKPVCEVSPRVRVRVRRTRIIVNKEQSVREEDVYNQGLGIRIKKEASGHWKQDADSRHAANRTLPVNGRVVDGKRGPVKKWKKLDG